MSKEIESISSALFDKIRSRFAPVTLGDEKAKATQDPEKARFFNFTYSSNAVSNDADTEPSDPIPFGKITVSLIDEESLKIYFSQNITRNMDEAQRKQWYEFLRNLRQFSRRNLLKFDTRDITKSNLDVRDIKQQARTDDVYSSDEIKVTESRLYGTPGRPYNSMAETGKTKILVRHRDRVNDEVRGARTRKIEEIFLETDRGERFLLSHTNLHGAYAMAEHLNQGGTVYDSIAEGIDDMVSEMSAMRHFVRSTKLREFEDQETAEMTQAAVKHYERLKNTLKRLRSPKQYNEFVSTYTPTTPVEEEIDVDALRERFVKKVYDDRFEDALPIVFREYQRQKMEAAGQVGTELDEWANYVMEEELPSDDKMTALAKLLQAPIRAGINGIDAISQLKRLLPTYHIDELTDTIEDYAGVAGQGPDADVRAIIKVWLTTHMPEVLDNVEFGKNGQDDAQTNYAAPVSPDQAEPNDQYGATGMDEPNINESDDMSFLRRLAGLKR